jgi:hypothetical protein
MFQGGCPSPRAAQGPVHRLTRTASAPRRVPNQGEVAPSVAGPSERLVDFLRVAAGTGSSESGLTPCPSSAPFTHARGQRVKRDWGPDTPPSLGPLRCARPGSGLMNDPGSTRIHVPQSPRAGPLPRPSSDRASGTPALRPCLRPGNRRPSAYQSEGSLDHGPGPDLWPLRPRDCR